MSSYEEAVHAVANDLLSVRQTIATLQAENAALRAFCLAAAQTLPTDRRKTLECFSMLCERFRPDEGAADAVERFDLVSGMLSHAILAGPEPVPPSP